MVAVYAVLVLAEGHSLLINNARKLCLRGKIVKYTKELSFFKNCKFLSSSKKIVEEKVENDVWQPIFDQPL